MIRAAHIALLLFMLVTGITFVWWLGYGLFCLAKGRWRRR